MSALVMGMGCAPWVDLGFSCIFFENLEGDDIIILIFCKEYLIVMGLVGGNRDEDRGTSKIMRKGAHGVSGSVTVG